MKPFNDFEYDQSDCVEIKGKKIQGGKVSISGFKHLMAPLITSSFLVEGKVEIDNVPKLKETEVFISVIRYLGGEAKLVENKLMIDTKNLVYKDLDEDIIGRIHGTVYLMPIMLGRFGKVMMGQSGGCQIGSTTGAGKRPVEHMIDVLRRFGADIFEKDGYIEGYCEKLQGCEIDIKMYSDSEEVITGPYVSGATKTAILSAITANGVTKIKNPYRKPDVLELIEFLKLSGVQIIDNGYELSIVGVEKLNEINCDLMSDLIEIMTFITYSAHYNVPMVLENIKGDYIYDGLKAEFELLKDMGIGVEFESNKINIEPPTKIKPVNIEVTSQSIFSDSHPLFTLMLMSADGPSIIKEKVWKNRFQYAHELNKIGAKLDIGDDYVKIYPSRPKLGNQELLATDVRAAATLLLASLDLEGKTMIKGISHLNRGYENLIDKLVDLQCDIERIA